MGILDQSAVSLSTRKMRKIVNESTLRLLDGVDDSENKEEEDDDVGDEYFAMKAVLAQKVYFDAFMRHLIKDFNPECLLCILEMMNFKNRIFNEDLSENQRQRYIKSKVRKATKHFLRIPKRCPRSAIMFNRSERKEFDWRSMARALYKKYIKEGAPHQVPLEHETRKRYHELLDSRSSWKMNVEFDNELKLYCLFDHCLLQLHTLLLPTFHRFQNSDRYKLIEEEE